MTGLIRQRFSILLIAIVILGAGLRLYGLGSYPQLFNHDEMLIGYDAWSIWTTGRDQHGTPFPLRFRAYNDYVPPVAFYYTAPFVGLFSLTSESTRLPMVLSGILTIMLVACLTREWFGPGAGLLAALFLALDSWHIKYSRTALPATLVIFLITLGIYTFTLGIQQSKRLACFLVSGLSFALLFGTYSTMLLQAPLLIGACLVAALPKWRSALLWAVLCGIFASPFIIDQVIHWELYQTRFEDISTFQLANWPLQILITYLKHFSPRRLFLTGYNSHILRMPEGTGQLSWVIALLTLLGFAALIIRHRRTSSLNLPLLTLIWLITFPLAGSLTGDNPVEARSIHLLPLPSIMAALGAVAIGTWLKQSALRLVFYLAVLLGLGLHTGGFLTHFFDPALSIYNTDLKSVIERVEAQTSACDMIWLQSTNQTYIYYLFLAQFPPAEFQRLNVSKSTYTGLPYLYIPQVGNWRFGSTDAHEIPLSDAHCQNENARTVYITLQTNLPQEWERLEVGSSGLWQAVVLEQPVIEQSYWDRPNP